jgi:two-component system response regulator NreC
VLFEDRTGQQGDRAAKEPEPRLSPREKEVFRLVTLGYTNRQAAGVLHLSVKTVETYRARLMAKLGLRNRAELVRYALQRGLLEEE